MTALFTYATTHTAEWLGLAAVLYGFGWLMENADSFSDGNVGAAE